MKHKFFYSLFFLVLISAHINTLTETWLQCKHFSFVFFIFFVELERSKIYFLKIFPWSSFEMIQPKLGLSSTNLGAHPDPGSTQIMSLQLSNKIKLVHL